MYSTAPVSGLVLLVPTRFTRVHFSSPVSSMCLRAKDHLEDTKVAVFPRYCAPQDRQHSGLAATEEWRPGRRRATWLPEEEEATQSDELSGQRCYATATSGLHQSWWSLILRTEWETPTLRAALWVSISLSRLLDGLLRLRRRR